MNAACRMSNEHGLLVVSGNGSGYENEVVGKRR